MVKHHGHWRSHHQILDAGNYRETRVHLDMPAVALHPRRRLLKELASRVRRGRSGSPRDHGYAADAPAVHGIDIVVRCLVTDHGYPSCIAVPLDAFDRY